MERKSCIVEEEGGSCMEEEGEGEAVWKKQRQQRPRTDKKGQGWRQKETQGETIKQNEAHIGR